MTLPDSITTSNGEAVPFLLALDITLVTLQSLRDVLQASLRPGDPLTAAHIDSLLHDLTKA